MKAKLVEKDHGWRAFIERVKQIPNSHVKVGVLADDARGGLHVPGGKLTVAEIAAVNEFGTEDGRIPARSFVRSTFEEEREHLVDLGKELMRKVLEGMSVEQALNIMGSTLATAIKKKITVGEGIPPPNAPSTLRRKAMKGKGVRAARGKPSFDQKFEASKAGVRTLVDTGRLLGAITWSVVLGKGEPEK